MHQVIASPQHDKFVIVRPGAREGMHIPHDLYRELAKAVSQDRPVPPWLADAARQAWGLDISESPSKGTVLVRPVTRLNYGRATYEINKGCNFKCVH